MILGKAIFAQLSGNAPVAAVVSNRIFPDISPEIGKVYPLIAYGGDAAEEDQAYDGPVGMATQTVRITSLASGDTSAYGVVSDLANKIRQAIDGGSGNWGGIVIRGCFWESENESTEADESAGQSTVIYLIEQTYTIVYLTN